MATTKIMCSLEFICDAIGLPKGCVITAFDIKKNYGYVDITITMEKDIPERSDIKFRMHEIELSAKSICYEVRANWTHEPDVSWVARHTFIVPPVNLDIS